MIQSMRCQLVACLLDTPDLGHRREQLAAVAKGHREILEVLVCQVA
jgi:hypothetical protein